MALKAWALLVVLSCSIVCGEQDESGGPKLSLPRALLPFGAAPPSLRLHVSSAGGACYAWSSSREDVVAIQPERDGDGCSQSARISTFAHVTQRQTAIVFAADERSGRTLRCDVIVDRVRRLEVVTTSRQLFVEEAPEAFEVRAYDDQGNEFTTLDGVEFAWRVASALKGGDVIRIIDFARSSYEATAELAEMERRGKRTHTVLLEGVSTGTAKVSVKLPYPEYAALPPAEVTLRVVANLLIMPPDVSVLLNDIVDFKIIKVSEGRLIEVPQPSTQYWLEIEDSSIANLDKKTGRSLAKSLGATRVFLRDAGEGSEGDAGHLPEASVRVVTPHSLQLEFRPSPSSPMWSVQRDAPFSLLVHILDSQGRRIYVGTETRVRLDIDESMVDVKWRSTNGTVLNGIALQSGVATVHAKLLSVANVRVKDDISVDGEVHIFEKIEVIPPNAILPLHALHQHKSQIQLKAIGGDGTYNWRGEGSATVDSRGLVNANKLGNATIFASMTSNSNIYGTASISVIEPIKMEVTWYEEEGPVGSDLEIQVALFASVSTTSEKLIPVSSCNPLSFKVTTVEGINFELQTDKKSVEKRKTSDNSCTTLFVQCSESGSGLVKIQWGSLEAGLSLRCFAPVRRLFPPPTSEYLLLTVGSSHNVVFEGGPITWFDEESEKQHQLTNINPSVARISSFHTLYDSPYHVFTVTCLEVGTSEAHLKMMGHSSGSSNVISKSVDASVHIQCSNPNSLKLTLKQNVSGMCPAASLQQMVVLHGQAPVEVEVTVFDAHGNAFHNATSLRYRWSAKPTSILPELPFERLLTKTSTQYQVPIVNYHYQILRIAGDDIVSKSGLGEIRIDVLGFRNSVLKLADISKTPTLTHLPKSSLPLKLIMPGHVSNTRITIYNHPGSVISIPLLGGSGNFQLTTSNSVYAHVSLDSTGRSVKIQPYSDGEFTIAVQDLCVSYDPLNIHVTVVSIANIIANIPELIEKGQSVDCVVNYYDRSGSILSANLEGAPTLISRVTEGYVNVIPSKDNAQSSDGIVYTVTGLEIGDASIEFSAGTVRGSAHTYVFPHLKLVPPHSIILPGGNVKIGVVGGPPPPAVIVFGRGSPSRDVIDVDKTGIVNGIGIGVSDVKAHAEGFQGAEAIQATASVQVVALEGITIHAPTSTLLVDKTMPMWAMGIPDSITPLQLGSVKPALRFRWSISGEGAVSINDILSNTGVEFDDADRVAVRLTAVHPGSVTVHLNITALSSSVLGQLCGHSWYATYNLMVLQPLDLISPSMKSSHLILAPHSEIFLETNYPADKITYKLTEGTEGQGSPLAKITSDGKLTTYGQSGLAIVTINSEDPSTSIKQHLAVTVEICVPHYSMIQLDMKYNWDILQGLGALPSGLTLPLILSKYDILGRKFSDSAKFIQYFTNRPDIILPGANSSHFLEILLASPGHAVIKIWDEAFKNQFLDYMSLEILPAIYPQKIIATVGDMWCMRSALKGGTWVENVSEAVWTTNSGLMQARASRAAASILLYQSPAGIPYGTQATVITRPADMIYFLDVEKKHTVTDERPHVVSLVLANKEEQNKLSNLIFNEHNCLEAGIDSYPFTCEIRQSDDLYIPDIDATPVLNKALGTYGCQITWSPDSSLQLLNNTDSVKLIARVGSYATEPLTVRCVRAAKIANDNIVLSPPPAYLAPFDVTATPEVLKELQLISDNEILSVDAPLRISDTSLRFIIRGGKNIVGVQKSHVRLISPLTHQSLKIPVSINGNGATGFLGTCVTGGSSFISQLFEQYQFFLLIVVTFLSIFAAAVYVFGNVITPLRNRNAPINAGNATVHDLSSDVRSMSYSSRSPFMRSPASYSQSELSTSIHTSPNSPLDTSGSAVYGDPSYLAPFERRRNRRFL